jgi:hypothetical protein
LRTQKTPQRARHDRQRARSRLLVKKQPAQDLISQAAANARIVSRSLNQRQVNHVMKTIGVDVGGTFTDLVYCDMASGELAVHKVATTPDDPSLGVIAGTSHLCDNVGVAAASIDFVFHGTTTATNAVLEHKGARCGMITNEGFRDILHIARRQRSADVDERARQVGTGSDSLLGSKGERYLMLRRFSWTQRRGQCSVD